MAPQGLSDDQVAGELRKMVEFIKQEADEKAREIELKANEEYEIEKANIVRSECAAIDEQYEAKYKQAALRQQTVKSTLANKSRLKVLAAREQVLNDIFEAAQAQLKSATADSAKYETTLQGLILEGLYGLLEDKVRVRVRPGDVAVAKKAIGGAIEAYKAKTGRDVVVEVDEAHSLDDKSAGGVQITDASGRIVIDNSLAQRLAVLSESALPQIRLALLGPSPTRKFFD